MPKAQRSKKGPAPAPYDVAKAKSAARKNAKAETDRNPLFVATPRSKSLLGPRDVKDMTHFVKWPKYVQVQRKKRVLEERLKVPPVLNQFNLPADKNLSANIFALLSKYQPETKHEKKARLFEWAKQKADNPEWVVPKAPAVLKFGINHVTGLIEQKKAKFVVIAHDVSPIEVVVWLPALCRKMGVPYAIVKGKARLGQLVHQKQATCVALTRVEQADAAALSTLTEAALASFTRNVASRRQFGGQKLGAKSKAAKRKKAAAARRR